MGPFGRWADEPPRAQRGQWPATLPAAAGSGQVREIRKVQIAETRFLLRLEKSDVLCCEWVESSLELANVAISLFFASRRAETCASEPAQKVLSRLRAGLRRGSLSSVPLGVARDTFGLVTGETSVQAGGTRSAGSVQASSSPPFQDEDALDQRSQTPRKYYRLELVATLCFE
jgi:hypothetical protein